MTGTTRPDDDPAERWAAAEAARARAGTIDADWQEQARERATEAREPLGLVRRHLAQSGRQPGATRWLP
jgi:hypothetical protein